MSKHIDLAKKLKALSEKGEGGEKVNAEKMLNDLLKKHKLTLEDLEGEEKKTYFFNLKPEDLALWNQIVRKVNWQIRAYGEFPKKKIRELNLEGNFMIECTASEYIEIDTMLEIYTKLYKEELDIFFTAFCKANNLLVSRKNATEAKELTDKQLEDTRRAYEMADKIKTEQFRKQLKQENQ